jgi:uncharacterized protein YqjF (DUF2071 family)
LKTFLRANWQNIIMANYEIDPQLLEPYLPKGVELDFYQGKTYVSLVGFMFNKTSIFNVPIPFIGSFEEVNLRFYVIRKTASGAKRGVVFINETVPNKLVAWLANKLYKEHYLAVPTKHTIILNNHAKDVKYEWKVNGAWNHIRVKSSVGKQKMIAGSMEEFIFEHYFGYTKLDGNSSMEYQINHPSWEINQVIQHEISCNFAEFYGKKFEILNHTKPNSVFIAEGSAISVDWKRVRFTNPTFAD